MLREVAQWFRALDALPEAPGSNPNIHKAANNGLSEDLMSSSGLHGNCLHMVKRHTYKQHTNTYKIK